MKVQVVVRAADGLGQLLDLRLADLGPNVKASQLLKALEAHLPPGQRAADLVVLKPKPDGGAGPAETYRAQEVRALTFATHPGPDLAHTHTHTLLAITVCV